MFQHADSHSQFQNQALVDWRFPDAWIDQDSPEAIDAKMQANEKKSSIRMYIHQNLNYSDCSRLVTNSL